MNINQIALHQLPKSSSLPLDIQVNNSIQYPESFQPQMELRSTPGLSFLRSMVSLQAVFPPLVQRLYSTRNLLKLLFGCG